MVHIRMQNVQEMYSMFLLLAILMSFGRANNAAHIIFKVKL